jgi:hypothetical protein
MNNFGTEYLSYEFLKEYIRKTVNSLYFTSEKYLNEYPQGYTDTENKFPAVIDKVQFCGNYIYVRFLYNTTYFYMYYSLTDAFWTKTYTSESILYLEFDSKETIWLVSKKEDSVLFACQELSFNGIYIMSDNFTLEYFLRISADNGSKYVTEFLMDTNLIIGVTNDLKCEVLSYSKISPKRQINTLSQDKLEKIYEGIIIISRLLFNTTINLYDYKYEIFNNRNAKKEKLNDNNLTYWNPEKQF